MIRLCICHAVMEGIRGLMFEGLFGEEFEIIDTIFVKVGGG